MKKFTVAEGCVAQAYRFALDPSPAQARALASHAGAARRAYNWAVGRIKANWEQRRAEESYGLSGDELTPWQGWTLPALRKDWNSVKDQVAPWWAENSKEAYSTGLANAAAAMKNWHDSRTGRRKGALAGFPRFKPKHKGNPSCRFTTGAIRVEGDRRHVTLPRLGTIRTHESMRKLSRRLEAGTARVLSATVRERAGRWHVSFQVEVKRAERAPARAGAAVGVDVGIKYLAVLGDSQGEIRYVPNPRHMNQALAGLRRASRRLARREGPAVIDAATGRKTGRRDPSAGWEKARDRLARTHHRVGNLRRDGLHKLTTSLAREYGHVVVEDLNVSGMIRNRRLARHVADASFGEIRRQLAYKTTWNGGMLVLADRWFPSSKTCSGCGAVKAKLPLHIRVYECDPCGLVMDRDANAARNLAALAAASIAGTGVAGDLGAQAPNASGADRKTRRYHPGPGRDGRAGGVETGHRTQGTSPGTDRLPRKGRLAEVH